MWSQTQICNSIYSFGDVCKRDKWVCILQGCHFNRWEPEEYRPIKITRIPFTASVYWFVSLTPLISSSKACVILFSLECCSVRLWSGICPQLLLLPLHDLIRMRQALTLSLLICLGCCVPSSQPPCLTTSCITLQVFLHPGASSRDSDCVF